MANRIIYQAGFDAICANPITCNQPNWTRDANTNQTDFTYDPVHGGYLTVNLPAPQIGGIRPQIRYTYTAFNTGGGLLYRETQRAMCITASSCAGTAGEQRTSTSYWNGTFLPQTVTSSGGDGSQSATVTNAYDAAGRRTQATDARNNVTTYRYDAVGRLVGEISPDPGSGVRVARRISYNGDDQETVIENGTVTGTSEAAWLAFATLRTLTNSYDSVGRKIKTTLSGGGTTVSVTQYSYDSLDRLACTAVRMNPALFASPPADVCTPGPQGTGVNDFGPDRITRAVYDAAGQRVQLREGVGTFVEGTEATWVYSPNGQVTTVIDGNGNRAELRYDGYDRQDRWTFPGTSGPPPLFNDATPATALATAGSVNANDYEGYGYDDNGNRTTLRKRDGASGGYQNGGIVTYQYDALNRMTARIVPARTSGTQALTAAQTRDVYYSYDLRGLQLSARFDSQAGEGVTNAYDAVGRLTSSSTNMGGTTRTLGYVYDATGNRIRITHPGTQFFDYRYDSLNRMYGLLENGVTWIAALTYDAGGARATLGRGGTGVIYTNDALGRLTGLAQVIAAPAAVAWTFGRNPASQITSTTRDNDSYAWTRHYAVNRPYTTNGLNHYTNVSGTGFTYDANGNLISDGANSYVYDIENRLVSASGAHNATLTYDPLGRLWQVASGASTTRFLYDGDALVAEYDAAGAVTARYVHGPGADEPWFRYDGALVSDTTRRQLDADWQGSIVGITDATGHSLAIDTYDEYGFPGLNNQGRFQYTGQAWLAELGMYYYKARIYSPGLGRFMQTDPIGYAGGYNLYAYVNDDPVNGTDPLGTYVCEGSKDQCTAARIFWRGVKIASRSNRLTSDQRATLRGVLGQLGEEGARNGVVVGFGNLSGEATGSTGTVGLGIGRITLDLGRIREVGNDIAQRNHVSRAMGWFVAGTETLAHEGGHLWYGPLSGTVGSILGTERYAYPIGFSALEAYGVGRSGAWEPGISARELRRRIENGAIRSCQSQSVAMASYCATVSAQQGH